MSSAAPPTPTTHIAATGTAELRVPPDRATLHVAIRSTAAEGLRAAARESVPLEQAILRALEKTGLPRTAITTLRYDTGREQRYEKMNWVPGDYYVEHVLAVEIENLEHIGATIAAAREAGATRIAGIRFWVADEEVHRERATAQAVAQAFARARTLATAAGARLGRVVLLGTPEALAATRGVGGGSSGHDMRFAVAEAAAPYRHDDGDDAEVEPLILPVPITISAVVHGAWTIEVVEGDQS